MGCSAFKSIDYLDVVGSSAVSPQLLGAVRAALCSTRKVVSERLDPNPI